MSIEHLKDDVEASVLCIAPERHAALLDFFAERPVQFIWTTQRKSLPKVDAIEAKIFRPAPGLMLLWTASLKSWVIYDEHRADQARGLNYFDLIGTQRRIKAQLAFEWGLENFRRSDLPVVDILTLPVPAQAASDNQTANELFLAAIAWILHHEIAHLRLGHTNIPAILLQEEAHAGTEALSWILELEHDDQRRKKRVLGACVAVLTLTALDLNRGVFDNGTHPRAFDRMYRCLEESRLPDDHVAFAFCTTMVRAEMAKLRHALPQEEGSNLRAMFYSHLMALREVTTVAPVQ